MFDSKTTLTDRLVDAADLLIDFATLGEYGMEPVESRRGTECSGPRRRAATRHGTRHRGDVRGRGVAARAL
jgi:hypothetical protein